MKRKTLRIARQLCAAAALVISFTISAQPAPSPEVKSLENSSPNRILFVGNSYFYYNDSLHNHIGRLVDSFLPEGEESQRAYKSATIGGAALNHHDISHLLTPGQLGIDEPFELVILQGGSGEPLNPRRRRVFSETAAEFNATIRRSGAQTALYMTHAYAPPHRRYDPKMIDAIESLYVETANSLDALVIPVGLAFEEAYRRRPDLKLHKHFDGSHPELVGTYLAACVVYASVFGKSPVGSDYDYYGEISKEDTRFLQQVAQDTVAEFFGR